MTNIKIDSIITEISKSNMTSDYICPAAAGHV